MSYYVSMNYMGSKEAWVGFRNNSGLSWLGLLRPGFRHCFVALRWTDGWVVYDPLAHHTRLDVVAGGYELLDYFCEQGCLMLPVALAEPERRALPWRPFTCVEAVKRVLGLCCPGVVTPWQLYKHIVNCHKKIS